MRRWKHAPLVQPQAEDESRRAQPSGSASDMCRVVVARVLVGRWRLYAHGAACRAPSRAFIKLCFSVPAWFMCAGCVRRKGAAVWGSGVEPRWKCANHTTQTSNKRNWAATATWWERKTCDPNR